MYDRQVNLGCVIAGGMWLLTAALLVSAALVFDVSAHLSLMLAMVGLATSAAAATATIRRYFVAMQREMRNAFKLGEDSATHLRQVR